MDTAKTALCGAACHETAARRLLDVCLISTFFILSKGVYMKCSHCAVIESSQLNIRIVVEMKKYHNIVWCETPLVPTPTLRDYFCLQLCCFLYRLQNGNCGFQGTFLPVCRASG